MIIKASSVPLHIQMADEIRDQIRMHELQPNDRLPSERELCERYNISRITVRKALGTLIQEGFVHSAIGKGTYVSEKPLNEELRPLNSFTQDLELRGMKASSQVLDLTITPANDGFAARFHIPRGAELVRLHRLRLADGLPIALQTTYLPHHLCPDLHKASFIEHSLYAVLRDQYGFRLVRSDTAISAALALANEIQLLGLKKPAAVLISDQTTYLEDGVVIEMTHSVFHADRYKLYTRS